MIKLQFFQERDQREHISYQLKFYTKHAGGLGRMLLRSNLKLIFRRFASLKYYESTDVNREKWTSYLPSVPGGYYDRMEF